MAITPKSSWPWVKTLRHSVFDQPDAQSVAAQYDRIVDALSDKLPHVADHLEHARADLLAFTAFPNRSGAKSGPTTPRNASTKRSAGAPMLSASSPTATPSSASSAPSSPNNTTNGSNQRRYLALDVLSKSRTHHRYPHRTGGHPRSTNRKSQKSKNHTTTSYTTSLDLTT